MIMRTFANSLYKPVGQVQPHHAADDLPLSTWIVAPTSTGRRAASFRPEIEIGGGTTRVLVEQLTVIDPQQRLGEFVGRLSTGELQDVDTALRSVLALD